MVWTKFLNVGKMPTDREYPLALFVELPQEEAVEVFKRVTGFGPVVHNPQTGEWGHTYITAGERVEGDLAYYRHLPGDIYVGRIWFFGREDLEELLTPPPTRSRVVTLLAEEPA